MYNVDELGPDHEVFLQKIVSLYDKREYSKEERKSQRQ